MSIISESAEQAGAQAPAKAPALRDYSVVLVTKGFFVGTVEAVSIEDAIDRTFHIWRTECPHPFEKSDDSELISVVAEEVQS